MQFWFALGKYMLVVAFVLAIIFNKKADLQLTLGDFIMLGTAAGIAGIDKLKTLTTK